MRFWVPVWKKAPFLRLLLPLMAGILLEWYYAIGIREILIAAGSFLLAMGAFHLLPLVLRFKLHMLRGILINLLLAVLGLLVTYQKDIRHRQNWFGNFYHDSDYIVATINEPLLEKSKSYKAEALITTVIHGHSPEAAAGKVILYFQNDSGMHPLKYGDEILISKKLQEIKNSGNPGAFDYKQYAAFKQVYHNVFLKNTEWRVLEKKNINYFDRFLFTARQNVLDILRKNLQGHDDQLSISEALLIGYTEDLDKDLVQAYSNTGVVHIIAISGMHLALIYVMLVWIFNRIPFVRRSKIIKVIFILSCLWLFSLLTGGAASILRSAVMFSCIVIGENFARRSTIYNSLAASAFLLLCYNPYFLWDVGFQLSYFAVLGIVIFQRPIYHLLYIKNKWINKIWALMSVSLAAQVFTFPVCIYYFHQFPTLFLFTNIIMVPLSTLILFVEIALVALSWIPGIGVLIGKLTWLLVWLMNKIILWFNGLPFALWDRISASVTSTIVLYLLVISTGFWLLNKNKSAFKLSLYMMLMFIGLVAYSKWQTAAQQKLIVYNVPQYQAIDLIEGNSYKFIGDSVLLQNGMLQNFHLKPGRISLQLSERSDSLPDLYGYNNFFQFGSKRILLIDKPVVFEADKKINVDYIIVSKNPKLYISQLANVFSCGQYIFDGANSLWKIDRWKKECEKLHLQCWSVPDRGAFVTDL